MAMTGDRHCGEDKERPRSQRIYAQEVHAVHARHMRNERLRGEVCGQSSPSGSDVYCGQWRA